MSLNEVPVVILALQRFKLLDIINDDRRQSLAVSTKHRVRMTGPVEKLGPHQVAQLSVGQ